MARSLLWPLPLTLYSVQCTVCADSTQQDGVKWELYDSHTQPAKVPSPSVTAPLKCLHLQHKAFVIYLSSHYRHDIRAQAMKALCTAAVHTLGRICTHVYPPTPPSASHSSDTVATHSVTASTPLSAPRTSPLPPLTPRAAASPIAAHICRVSSTTGSV